MRTNNKGLLVALEHLLDAIHSSNEDRNPEYFYLSKTNVYKYYDLVREEYKKYERIGNVVKDFFGSESKEKFLEHNALTYNNIPVMIDLSLPDDEIRAMTTKPYYQDWKEKMVTNYPKGEQNV